MLLPVALLQGNVQRRVPDLPRARLCVAATRQICSRVSRSHSLHPSMRGREPRFCVELSHGLIHLQIDIRRRTVTFAARMNGFRNAETAFVFRDSICGKSPGHSVLHFGMRKNHHMSLETNSIDVSRYIRKVDTISMKQTLRASAAAFFPEPVGGVAYSGRALLAFLRWRGWYIRKDPRRLRDHGLFADP